MGSRWRCGKISKRFTRTAESTYWIAAFIYKLLMQGKQKSDGLPFQEPSLLCENFTFQLLAVFIYGDFYGVVVPGEKKTGAIYTHTTASLVGNAVNR